MRRRGIFSVSIIAALLACARPARAQDPVHKLGRGLTNVSTGWIEVPKQVYLGTHEHNPVVGAALGLGKGFSQAVLRTGIGLYEALTFPIPCPRAYTSAYYQQMGLADFAWE